MKEKLTLLKPKNVIESYDIESISFIDNELSITLSSSNNNKQKIKASFGGITFAYKYSKNYECLCHSHYDNLQSKDTCIHDNWSFFQVINSQHIQWLSTISITASDIHNLKHFIISSSSEKIEIFHPNEPKITILNPIK